MLACEVSASIDWARGRVRGIMSMLAAVTPALASCPASAGSVSGASIPNSACPARSPAIAAGSGFPTIKMMSADQASSRGTTDAPASA